MGWEYVGRRHEVAMAEHIYSRIGMWDDSSRWCVDDGCLGVGEFGYSTWIAFVLRCI